MRYSPYLKLYLPLYLLDGKKFVSKDLYAHACTVTGALWRLNGRSFDGTDDNIDAGASAVLKFTSSYSLVVWARHSVITGEQAYISSQVGGTSGFGLQKANTTNKPNFLPVASGNSLSGNTTLLINVWYHIVGVYDASTNRMHIYLNGISDKTPISALTPVASTANLFIGRYGASSANLMNGLIGEVWIYSRALIRQEIRHHYLETKWRYKT